MANKRIKLNVTVILVLGSFAGVLLCIQIFTVSEDTSFSYSNPSSKSTNDQQTKVKLHGVGSSCLPDYECFCILGQIEFAGGFYQFTHLPIFFPKDQRKHNKSRDEMNADLCLFCLIGHIMLFIPFE